MCKTSSRGGGAYVQISLSADNYYNDNPTASTTYTFTQSYSSVSIPMHRTLNGGGAQASHTIAITVKRGNDTIFSKSQVAGYLSPIDTGEMITVADMQIGEVLTFQITVGGRYGEGSQNAYGSFTATINGQQAGSVKRNLIPTEIKTLGQQAVATLFGRLGESERYGEITGTTNTATTGNISLGNAVGFITMEYNGYVIKIPYYN